MYKVKKQKSSFRQDIQILYRAIKELHRMEPKALPVCVFSAVFSSFSPFVNIYFSARIIEELIGNKELNRLVFLIGLTIGFNLLIHIIMQAADKANQIFYVRLGYLELNKTSEVFLHSDFEELENPHFQDLKRDYRGARQKNGPLLSWGFLDDISNTIKCFLGIVFSIVLAFTLFFTLGENTQYPFLTSPWFSATMGIAVICATFFSLLLTKKETSENFRLASNFIKTNRQFTYYDTVANRYEFGKEIRIYREQEMLDENFQEMNRESNGFISQMARNTSLYEGGIAIISALLSGIAYLFVALKALIGVFGVGMVVQYVGAINQFTTNFTGFVTTLTTMRQRVNYQRYYFDIIDTKPVKYEGHIPIEKRDDNDYEIEFRNVSFQYPGSNEWALKDFSIKLCIGERMAIVGSNGSGKTTFIKLLCRLYDPTKGEILLNGIDIRKYDYEEYLSIFSVVFQDFCLFSFPLDQNVATSIELDESRVRECLARAGFTERLDSMPDGLQTPLYKDFEENGVEISGGEAQKIALARALYKDAPFIVLDEPTAALDPIAEYEIYAKFNELVGGKTAIYISHRLSSCRFCNDIAVFDKGQLIQRGNHESLLSEEDSIYAKLWNAQAQYYIERQDEQKNSQYLPI